MATTPLSPTMGEGHGFTHGPPDTLKTENFELYNYLQMLHSHLFGLEGDTGDVHAFHDEGSHGQLSQAAAVADMTLTLEETEQSVDSADPTGGSEASQITAIIEIKDDLNDFFDEYNDTITALGEVKTKLNALLAALRAAGILAT